MCCYAHTHALYVCMSFRLKASEVGLLTCAAFMGAPTIIFEKLVAGSETQLALEALERVLASGLYTGEGEEGRKGNERVRVTEKELGKGKKVWIANTADINKIDVSNPAEIEQVRNTRPNMIIDESTYIHIFYMYIHNLCI